MRTATALLAGVLFAACLCFAQQSPPADGVGLGNNSSSTNSNTSSVPVTSPNQNSTVTDATGSVSGDKQPSAYGGAPAASTATSVRTQGSTGATEAAHQNSAGRQPNGTKHSLPMPPPKQGADTGSQQPRQQNQNTPQ